MTRCPRLDELEALAGSEATHGWSDHVDECASCRRHLHRIRQEAAFLDELREADREQTPARRPCDAAPREFHGYRLLGEVHRGGQGIVHRAIQHSTNRIVALKVLMNGALATGSERARFAREIDVIAHLHHPNIVTIFDSGVTDEGIAYCAMEYIDGVRLDRYANEHLPHVRDRLALIETVCKAVSYAHQHGIIHRDLKPANILVDERGQPCVLDFGLAKRSDAGADTAGLSITASGGFLGTLAYASPEHLAEGPHAVEARSDVYSLGVIMYEVLAGRHPFPCEGRAADLLERMTAGKMERPSQISRCVDDEIETIILKAMSRAPERRYQSADALAADIRRYLDGVPIDAKRDSTYYVFRKNLQRHRLAAGTVVGIMSLVLGFGIAMTASYRQADAARRVAQDQSTRAEASARSARRIQVFLQDMLSSADPKTSRGRELTVREVLDRAAARIDEELTDDPLVEAAVRCTVGKTYGALGKYEAAEAHLKAALAIRREHLDSPHPELLESIESLGTLLLERQECPETEALFLEALEMARALYGPDHPRSVTALDNLAVLHRVKRNHVKAERSLREVLAIRLRTRGAASAVATTLNNIGAVLFVQGKYPKAETYYRRALDTRRRVLDENHPLIAQSANNLGGALRKQGKLEEAGSFYHLSLEIRREILSPDHPDLARSLQSLAALLRTQDHLEDSEAMFREALEIREQSLGAGDWRTANTASGLGECLMKQGRFREARPLLEASHRVIAGIRGSEDRFTREARDRLDRLNVAGLGGA